MTNSKWIAQTNDCKSNPLQGSVTQCSKNELIRVGLKRLFLFWLGATICVFIPILHFFLVPLFFIIGIIAFIRTQRCNLKIQSASYLCPSCQVQNKIKEVWFEENYRARCEACAIQVIITEESIEVTEC